MSGRYQREAAGAVSTRDLLVDEAERQIAERGLDGFILKDLAEPLGIRVPSIYTHFSSREDLVTTVAGRYVSALAEQFPDDGRADTMSALMEGVRGLVIYFASHPAHVRLKLRDLEAPGGRPELSAAAGGEPSENLASGPLLAFFNRLEAILQRGYEAGQFRQVDHISFYRVVFGTLLISLTWPVQDIFTTSQNPQEISRILPLVEDVARRFVSP